MINEKWDVVIVGAGPVGLMCAYLGALRGLRVVAIDRSAGPLKVGRADALNARTLQLLEVAGLFDELYPLGRPCNTSSVWADGKFVSRQSAWWDDLEGCLHKHFLMLGQSYVEELLDRKLGERGAPVLRSSSIKHIEEQKDGCVTTLESGERLLSKYVIGADGGRSFVRNLFEIPFEIKRPEIAWTAIDGVIETDFPKAPEIVVFQAQSADVAWIPREGEIDRFYVRMDTPEFSFEDAVAAINRAMSPHKLKFKKVEWFSQYSVKESVAQSFRAGKRVFLAGDACHVHSMNGGQGLNTGLADAFNLMWKLDLRIRGLATENLLDSYQEERRPVAESVIESSGALARSTKYSATGEHAREYVDIIKRRAGNITGMGIRYGKKGPVGERLFDFNIEGSRLYSLLNYSQHSLLVFDGERVDFEPPKGVKLIHINSERTDSPYRKQALLVRPDAYIERVLSLSELKSAVIA